MAKLYFRYGAMNSGKSTALMQVAYNYEEKGHRVLVAKSAIDSKGEHELVARIGIRRKVDIILNENSRLYPLDEKYLNPKVSCLLIDEAQFLTEMQVMDLFIISKIYDIPVICYGLRTDFKTNGFKGSSRLLEMADELTELITICSCGKTARFNARKINGKYLDDGEQVLIDDGKSVAEYEPLCGECYLKKVKKM